jgi:hypothetical protein
MIESVRRFASATRATFFFKPPLVLSGLDLQQMWV